MLKFLGKVTKDNSAYFIFDIHMEFFSPLSQIGIYGCFIYV